MVEIPIPKRTWLVTLLCALTLVWAAMATPVEAAQDAGKTVTIDLNEVDHSGVTGTAILTAQDGQTTIEMTLEGTGVKGNHPTHIHTGTCADFDPNPLIPLETFVLEPVNQTGKSVSTIDTSLESLQSGDYVILAHLSPEALTTYLVCGEIPRAESTDHTAAPPVAATGGHATHDASTPVASTTTVMPVAGVGSSLPQVNGFEPAIGLAVTAGFLLIIAVGIKRREST